jgi:hypothetical protein
MMTTGAVCDERFMWHRPLGLPGAVGVTQPEPFVEGPEPNTYS